MSRDFHCWRIVFPTIALFFLLPADSALATPSRKQIAAICDSAARVASAESDVPLDVLRAISLTETGRQADGAFLPWPWTVNMEGVGKWFDTVPKAQAYVDRHFARGARSFDVGCFQINYRWHGHAFDSIEDMFDPVTNARYAARFLGELYAELGDWSRAAGAYHSRTPKYARKYQARFDRIRAKLSDLPPVILAGPPIPDPAQPQQEQRVNNFPLLRRQGSVSGLASLVPLDTGHRRLIDITAVRSIVEQR